MELRLVIPLIHPIRALNPVNHPNVEPLRRLVHWYAYPARGIFAATSAAMSVHSRKTGMARNNVQMNGEPALREPAAKPAKSAVVALMGESARANGRRRPPERSSFCVYPNSARRASSSSPTIRGGGVSDRPWGCGSTRKTPYYRALGVRAPNEE